MGGDEDRKLNRSVIKAITVLRAVSADPDANVSSLARDAGLPRATALRLVQTLEQEGFLIRAAGGDRVLLGPELFRLVRGADDQQALQEIARPVISDLVVTVRESVTLSLPAADGGFDVVEQIDAPTQLGLRSWLGERFPLHCSATGKVQLSTWSEDELTEYLSEPLERFTDRTITDPRQLRAELRVVRSQGFATARDEQEEGLAGLAAGVFGTAHDLRGILCLSGPSQRLDRHRGLAASAHLLAAVDQIAAHLRGR